jgi:hypothetical protein
VPDEVGQQAFPDGIIWITVGKEAAFDIVTRMREVGKALNDDLTRYDNELGSEITIRQPQVSGRAQRVRSSIRKLEHSTYYRSEGARCRE